VKESDINKSEKRKLNFEVAYNVVKFLASLPKDIRNIFVPKNEDELLSLELNITRFSSREKEREKVMDLQREFGLPLRPNQSLKDVLIRVRIAAIKKKLKGFQNNNDKEKD